MGSSIRLSLRGEKSPFFYFNGEDKMKIETTMRRVGSYSAMIVIPAFWLSKDEKFIIKNNGTIPVIMKIEDDVITITRRVKE